LPTLVVEKTRIFQVFQNLIENAIKFMDKPQGLIEIQCVEDEGFWRFSVIDNGPGIDPKYYDHIFQIFQTLRPRDELESTGIGLTLVKKIVELHGGKIWLKSTIGEGCQFFFTLPQTLTCGTIA
jgi:signal transduction histidine kinase